PLAAAAGASCRSAKPASATPTTGAKGCASARRITPRHARRLRCTNVNGGRGGGGGRHPLGLFGALPAYTVVNPPRTCRGAPTRLPQCPGFVDLALGGEIRGHDARAGGAEASGALCQGE